ncbi:MAG: TauD/TfdA family dioxygenase [Blastocatellia bacterium]|nr:TauD/TfdA family dioxygenase [Blastocatellia bacterium]
MKSQNIEDIYTLSPAQQGMLFQVLSDANNAMYVELWTCTLLGQFNVSAFEKAWQEIVSRHQALRTAFMWQGISKPVQVVHRHVSMPLEIYDWTTFPKDVQKEKFDHCLTEMTEAGSNITVAPLMKIALIKFDHFSYRFVWTIHHLIHDAWSIQIILKEVFTLYESFCQGKYLQLTPSKSYKDYVVWLKKQESEEAANFWSSFLKGFNQVTAITPDITNPTPSLYKAKKVEVSTETTTLLQEIARKNKVTLNELVQTVWSLLFSYYVKSSDIVFGVAFSGRPPSLEGVESIVGLFVNTLPVRVRIESNKTLLSLLGQLHTQQSIVCKFEYTPLGKILGWSEIQKSRQLFNTILIFLNPSMTASFENLGNVKIEDIVCTTQSNYPIALTIIPNQQLVIETLYDSGSFTDITISNLLRRFTWMLSSFPQNLETPAEMFLKQLEEDERQNKVMEAANKRKSNLDNLRNFKAKATKVSATNLVKTSFLSVDQNLPLVVSPSVHEIDLAVWASSSLDFINQKLLEYGGILFRGFNIKGVADFEAFVKTVSKDILKYQERSTPRTELGNGIYTSTEYPSHQHIALHNEFSYAYTWPMKICFYCEQAPLEGGETPIADSRKVFQFISSKVRQAFIEKDVMYLRNYGVGIDLGWQEAFQTDRREDVEEYCRKAPIDFEWKDSGRLRTSQRRPSVIKHPKTEEMLWFNQTHLFHISNLSPEVQASMLNTFGVEDLPRNACFGDGTEIPLEMLEEVRLAYKQATVSFLWEVGDILLLDNMLVAHGRNPFIGERKILVAMSDPFNSRSKE